MVPIGVTASNLVIGPSRIYINSFGAAEPADNSVTPNGYMVPPGGTWIDLGGTDGGITVEMDTTYTPKSVDQIPMDVGAALTEVKMSATTKLAEVTLANLQYAINQIAVVTPQAGYTTLDVPVGQAITQPKYAAIIVDGYAPATASGNPALRRIILRKVLNAAKVALDGDKKTQQSYDCTFTCYWVSDSIAPWHQIDEDD